MTKKQIFPDFDLDLDHEELEILSALEKHSLVDIPNMESEVYGFKQFFQAQQNKTKNINIRLVARDLQLIQNKANELGLPYQTLVGSLLHQYATGKIDFKTN